MVLEQWYQTHFGFGLNLKLFKCSSLADWTSKMMPNVTTKTIYTVTCSPTITLFFNVIGLLHFKSIHIGYIYRLAYSIITDLRDNIPATPWFANNEIIENTIFGDWIQSLPGRDNMSLYIFHDPLVLVVTHNCARIIRSKTASTSRFRFIWTTNF